MGGYIGATAVGLVTTAADVQGDITSTDTTPELILKNTTETDADGGRDGKITFKGEQSGGEESTLAQIQSSHDGSSDDQAADLIFKTNDGSDGASPTERLRIDSAGAILTATLGTDNVHLGEGAGASIVSGGNQNVVIGKDAGTAITTGDGNVAVGYQSLDANTTADNNTAIGISALGANSTGAGNTAVGQRALTANTTADSNVSVGKDSMFANTTGHSNNALGTSALQNNTTGNFSTGVGHTALFANTTGSNTAVGALALKTVTTGGNNVAVGREALEACTGDNNTAVGYRAGEAITAGIQNTFIGSNAGDATTNASDNVAVGFDALGTNVGGQNNVAVGPRALRDATVSSGNIYNTAVGSSAGVLISSGTKNTCLGGLAGQSITTGDYNVMVGYSVDVNTGGVDTSIVMGQSVTGVGSNNFTFGNGTTDSNIAFGATSITAPSDERYKEEIAASTAGLSFINDLRPVTFKWKKAKDLPSGHDAYIADGEDGCNDRVMLSNGETNHGFIAQEVKAAIDAHSEIKDGFRMWSEDYREDADGNQITDNRQRIAPSELIPILTKAIQELSAKNDALEAQNTTQATQIADLITRVTALEAE
jgi:hypothetical protein